MYKTCNRYFVDNCRKGFTTWCVLDGSPGSLQCEYLTNVSCGGNFNNCDIVAEVKSWDIDSTCTNNTTYGETL